MDVRLVSFCLEPKILLSNSKLLVRTGQSEKDAIDYDNRTKLLHFAHSRLFAAMPPSSTVVSNASRSLNLSDVKQTATIRLFSKEKHKSNACLK